MRLQGGLFLKGRWAAWEGAAPYGAVAECLRRGLRQLNPEEAALLVGPYSRMLAAYFLTWSSTSMPGLTLPN